MLGPAIIAVVMAISAIGCGVLAAESKGRAQGAVTGTSGCGGTPVRWDQRSPSGPGMARVT
eukprot:1242960-Lingulodinium_polyedra.AAC.1